MTFEINCPDLEKLVEKRLENPAEGEIHIVGIEVYKAPPPPPPAPPQPVAAVFTSVIDTPPETRAAQLKARLKAKYQPTWLRWPPWKKKSNVPAVIQLPG